MNFYPLRDVKSFNWKGVNERVSFLDITKTIFVNNFEWKIGDNSFMKYIG